MEIFKSKGIKFGDEFYSIQNDKVITWKVYGISFMDYHRDEYGNKCCRHSGKPDIEYLIKTPDEIACVHSNNIDKIYFRTKEGLFNSLFK